MKIGFIGNYQSGYVGEQADEVHLTRELENLGHEIFRIPRDEWREYVIEEFPKDKYKNIPEDVIFDILIICKWHHFYDGSFIEKAKEKYQCPVFYFVWDFMPNPELPDWHIQMAEAANLYLSGELGIFDQYRALGVKPYYFQMDVCDGEIPIFDDLEKEYDLVFTGSCIDQGHRKEWLQEINKQIPVTIFSWNPEEWHKLGFQECYPAVYGEEYNQVIAKSKIVLGFNVEPNCFGYWSNRVGKVLRAGGFLLQEYAPGMETLLPESVKYFSSPEEAVAKIRYYLDHNAHREIKYNISKKAGKRFTSKHKVKALNVLMDRYLKGDPQQWMT